MADVAMSIVEWANLNGFTREQFEKEIIESMAAVGITEIEDRGYGFEAVWTVRDEVGPIHVIVKRS